MKIQQLKSRLSEKNQTVIISNQQLQSIKGGRKRTKARPTVSTAAGKSFF